ncbi:MAG: hypothetical protein RL462_30 [Pseudomonadota bacterium]|jgi:hypothetical protein
MAEGRAYINDEWRVNQVCTFTLKVEHARQCNF